MYFFFHVFLHDLSGKGKKDDKDKEGDMDYSETLLLMMATLRPTPCGEGNPVEGRFAGSSLFTLTGAYFPWSGNLRGLAVTLTGAHFPWSGNLRGLAITLTGAYFPWRGNLRGFAVTLAGAHFPWSGNLRGLALTLTGAYFPWRGNLRGLADHLHPCGAPGGSHPSS